MEQSAEALGLEALVALAVERMKEKKRWPIKVPEMEPVKAESPSGSKVRAAC